MSDIIKGIFDWLGNLDDSPLGILITGVILAGLGYVMLRLDNWLLENNLPFADLIAMLGLLWFGLMILGLFLLAVGVIAIYQKYIEK